MSLPSELFSQCEMFKFDSFNCEKRARVLVKELVRDLTSSVFLKHHVQLVKSDAELTSRLAKLGQQ